MGGADREGEKGEEGVSVLEGPQGSGEGQVQGEEPNRCWMACCQKVSVGEEVSPGVREPGGGAWVMSGLRTISLPSFQSQRVTQRFDIPLGAPAPKFVIDPQPEEGSCGACSPSRAPGRRSCTLLSPFSTWRAQSTLAAAYPTGLPGPWPWAWMARGQSACLLSPWPPLSLFPPPCRDLALARSPL